MCYLMVLLIPTLGALGVKLLTPRRGVNLRSQMASQVGEGDTVDDQKDHGLDFGELSWGTSIPQPVRFYRRTGHLSGLHVTPFQTPQCMYK